MRSILCDISVSGEHIIAVFDAGYEIVTWCAKQQANLTCFVAVVDVQTRFLFTTYRAFTFRDVFERIEFFFAKTVVSTRTVVLLTYTDVVRILFHIRFEMLGMLFSPFFIGRHLSVQTFLRLPKTPSVVTASAHSAGFHFPIWMIDAGFVTSLFSSHELC